jgi:hypothetical protein
MEFAPAPAGSSRLDRARSSRRGACDCSLSQVACVAIAFMMGVGTTILMSTETRLGYVLPSHPAFSYAQQHTATPWCVCCHLYCNLCHDGKWRAVTRLCELGMSHLSLFAQCLGHVCVRSRWRGVGSDLSVETENVEYRSLWPARTDMTRTHTHARARA